MNAIVKATPVLLNAAGIEQAISVIKEAGDKLDDVIQQAAVSVVAHVEACGNITLLNRLYLSMPKGSRTNALAAFFLAVGKVKVAPAGKTKAEKEAAKAMPFLFDKFGKTDMTKAHATPWFTFKKPAAVGVEFGPDALAKALQAMILKIDKAIVAGELSANDPVVLKLKAAK